jgi:hypothetical protein
VVVLRRPTVAGLPKKLVLIAVVAIGLMAPGAALAYTSFNASISSTYYWRYSNTIDVTGYASFRDYDCQPSYACDWNVMAEFTLRRGYSSYGPIVGRAYAQTGQYGSSLRATFRVPSCRYIPRYQSVTYTVVMDAVAPNGQERQSSRTVFVRSCA